VGLAEALTKKNMKAIKFLLGLGLMLASSSVFSQLDGIVVEKYYQARAEDLTVANNNKEATSPSLTTGFVTYRVYVDLASGYRLSAVYGDGAHPATFSTTTSFFNSVDGGSVPPTITNNAFTQGAGALDSYFTLGNVIGTGKAGVIELEDNDGALTHTGALGANNPGGCFGSFSIFGTNGRDGIVTSTTNSTGTIQVAGLDGLTEALGAGGGNTVTFDNGSFASQTGIVGPTASTSNKVLIGQFTTDGVFTFTFNVQILPVGGTTAFKYVYSNAAAGETVAASLTLLANSAPTVSVAGTYVPSGDVAGGNVINGSSMKFTATAADNVLVSKVEFFDGATLLSTDTESPYEHLYTAVQGSHSITAVATDDQCVATTSSAYAFVSAANQAPTINLTTPDATTTVVGNTIAFTAAVTDPEGFPLSTGVQFYKNGVAISGALDTQAPYTYNYTVATGAFTITAKVSDHLSLEGTSNGVIITGLANNPPSVSITSPTSSQSFTSYVSLAAAQGVLPTPATLTNITFNISAADDIYGNVTGVELFVDGVSVGSDNTSSYSITWASTSGTKIITAVATDNNGATTTSAPLTLVINDALALPYEVKDVTQLCNLPTFCVPVQVSSTYTADNIKGYDIVMTYDATKVAPIPNANTGYNVTVNPLLLTGTGTPSASWVDATAAIQTPGVLNLSLSLTGNAPANAEWNGTNKDIFCVEFARIAPVSPAAAGFQPFEESTVGVSFLQESRITGVIEVPVTAGQMISTTQQNYVANLQYWNGNGAISYDIASPNTYLVTNIQGVLANGTYTSSFSNPNTPVAPVVPDVAGQFTHVLNTLVGGVRTAVPNISIQRDIVNNPNTSVLTIINSADAVIGKTILLNQPIGVSPNPTTPSVYQMIALDVNRDGVLSAGDISQMQQRTVGILEEFLQAWNYNADGTQAVGYAPSKDFLFIDPASLNSDPAYSISSTYPLGNAQSGGYWKGRVPVVPFYLPVNISNYSADDTSCPTVGTANYQGIMFGDANGSYATFTANGTVKANEEDYILVDLSNAIVEGTKVSVPVSIVSAETVNAFDLALGINENTLTFVSEEDVQLGSSSASFYKESDKTFRHTSFNTNNFTTNARVAFFTFETVDGTISEKDFTSEFGLLNDKEAAVRFTKSSDLTNNSVDIYPNPSNGMFSVTSKVDGRVDIVDVTGKLVHPGVVVKANQMIEVNMPELSAGVYFVRMYSNNSMTTERIVISE
jgi:hypothetical protein